MTTTSSIAIDSPCVRCGYNLRTLRPEERCPECGLGIARSLGLGQQLQDSRPAWIASLAWGAGLLLLASLLVGVSPFASEMAQFVTHLLWPYVYFGQIGFWSCIAVATLIHFIGCWLLTRPENPYARVDPLRRLAIPLRIAASGLLVTGAMMLTAEVAIHWWYWKAPFVPAPPWMRIMRDFGSLPIFFFAFCPLLQFILLRRLAQRVLNAHLFEHASIVGIGYPLSLLVLFYLAWMRLSLNTPLGYLLTLVAWVGSALFWLWSMYVFFLSTMAFTQAARVARRAWHEVDSAPEGL